MTHGPCHLLGYRYDIDIQTAQKFGVNSCIFRILVLYSYIVVNPNEAQPSQESIACVHVYVIKYPSRERG